MQVCAIIESWKGETPEKRNFQKFESEEIKMQKFRVEVECLSNGYVGIYDDCVKITKGIFWDDDIEENIIGTRLTFSDNSTATFRDGFKITIFV